MTLCAPEAPPSAASEGLAPRRAALEILQALSRGHATLDALLEAREARFARCAERRDLNLMHGLVFGTLRWRGRIDWALEHVSRRPLARLSDPIAQILRLGAFQILFLDRVPQAAAVGTCVALAKASRAPWAAGYVNAALRSLCRGAAALRLPDPAGDPEGALAVRGSLPTWLAERWCARFGFEEALLLAEALNRIPPITLRCNRLRTSREGLMAALHGTAADIAAAPHAPDGIFLRAPRCAIGAMQPFRAGWFQVQDEAAQIVTAMLAPRPGERILDACAGQGGKTGHIAQLMTDRGRVLALDRSAAKLARLEGEMIRLGLRAVQVWPHDLQHPLPPGSGVPFDRVLLDAPCSGLGVLQRNPDIKWRRLPAQLSSLAEGQGRLLDAAAPLVRPGGVLLYSVCSFEPEETEALVDRFLARHPDYRRDPPPAALSSRWPALFTAQGFLRTLPHRHGMDGFFAARLRRVGASPSASGIDF